jgi:hypothetical protein
LTSVVVAFVVVAFVVVALSLHLPFVSFVVAIAFVIGPGFSPDFNPIRKTGFSP